MINKKKGFTLIETLGAVLLLSVALVGPMVIAQKGLQASRISKDQNTAFNLAQDAVELIRFSRDTNCLRAGTSNCPVGLGVGTWLEGAGVDLTNCINAAGTQACYFDSLGNTPPTPQSCGAVGAPCPVMDYNATNNYFNYDLTGVATPFTRTVQIKYDPSCTGACNRAEADVIITVSWSDPVLHSIQVNESLYDWQ